MKPSKVRDRLEQSLVGGRIATVVRDDFELDLTDGFVIALTDDWVVLHDLDEGVHLDDIVMLRLQDVSRVWFRDDDDYHHRAVKGLGQRLAAFDCDAGVTTIQLIEAASARADIFAVRFEGLVEEPLCIGRLIRVRPKSFDMHYVGRDGVWAAESERWRYRDVTRIEVGGRYLSALNRFADPFPNG